jgi:hypothetical protein
MHRTVIFAVFLALAATPVVAQDWASYQNILDGFRVNFPGQPTVTEIRWTTEYDYTLPGRLYTASRGREKYSVTVVDYIGIEPLGIERSKKCPEGGEQCVGNNYGGPGYWKHDTRGAILWAVFNTFMKRGGEVTRYHWAHQDFIEGHQLQLTNKDGSRTFTFVGMHEMKLYIAEGTVPPGAPEPALFQQSMQWVDAQGVGVRYSSIYDHQFHGLRVIPPPARVGEVGR